MKPICLLASLLLTLPASASSLVHWGGKYITDDSAATNFTLGTATSLANGTIWKYNAAASKSPAVRYDSDASSATFYGALQMTYGSGSSGSQFARVVSDSATSDYLFFKTATAAGGSASASLAGLVFWNKADFLGGFGEAASIPLTSLTEWTSGVRFVRGTAEARFAVLNDGKWYLSETRYTQTTGASGADGTVFALNTINSSLWAEWSISGDTAPLNSAPGSYTVEASTLDNVQAVGLYFTTTINGTRAAEIHFEDFKVTAIPEAGSITLALLGAGAALGWLRLAPRK